MKVSIITVVFNGERFIRSAIDSVLSQDYPDIEYIIIDGASTDKTMEIVREYGDKVDRVISEPDKGIYDAMNKGVENSGGELIGILNADDFYAGNDVIRKVVAKMEESHADAVYGDLVYVDQDDADKVTRFWKAGEYREGLFRKGWMPPHPTFFVKREVYDRFGSYDLRLTSAADYELMLRFIHKHKIKISYVPEVLTRMRVGGKSNRSIRNRIRANREDRLAWKLNGLNPGMFTLIRKPLSKVGQFFRK